MTRLLILANFAVYFLITSPLSGTQAGPGDASFAEYIRLLADRIPGGVTDEIVRQISRYDLFTFSHGYKPGAPSVPDLIFSIFLHANIWHLLGNMLFLWIYGNNVEHRLGRVGYLVAYLVTGAAATVAFGLLAGNSMTPLIGASGAISGVLGLYFVLFPRNRIKVFVMLFPFLIDVWKVPARIVLGIYLVVDNLLPLMAGSETGVAYGAHLGGFVAGILIAGGIRLFDPREGRIHGWLRRLMPWRRQVIRKVPKSERRDPRSVIIDAEYLDD